MILLPEDILSAHVHVISMVPFHLPSLSQDVSCNSISELPESFYSLTSLRHLNLHRNDLRDLPEGKEHAQYFWGWVGQGCVSSAGWCSGYGCGGWSGWVCPLQDGGVSEKE